MARRAGRPLASPLWDSGSLVGKLLGVKEPISAGDAASDCLGSDAVTRFAVLFGERAGRTNHRVVTRSTGVDGL